MVFEYNINNILNLYWTYYYKVQKENNKNINLNIQLLTQQIMVLYYSSNYEGFSFSVKTKYLLYIVAFFFIII